MPPSSDPYGRNHNHVIPQPQPPPPKSSPKLLSLVIKALVMTSITSLFFLFVGLAAFVLFLFLAAGAFHRRSAHHRHHAQSPLPSSGFSSRHLKVLPQFRFRAQAQSQTTSSSPPPTDCVVCLDAFRDGQWCRKLAACNHVFHRRCVDMWLVKVSACPICRTRVRLDSEDADEVVGLDGEEEAKYLGNFNRNSNDLRVRVW